MAPTASAKSLRSTSGLTGESSRNWLEGLEKVKQLWKSLENYTVIRIPGHFTSSSFLEIFGTTKSF